MQIIHADEPSKTFYAKPLPLTDDPSWGDDAVDMEVTSESSRVYAAEVADGAWMAFEQAGETRDNSDEPVRLFEVDHAAVLDELTEEHEGSVRFTEGALEMAPAGEGGGGSGATPEQIRQEIDANSTKLAAIKAKTDLITTSGFTVRLVSPVAPDGTTMNLVRGDDYLNELSNPWTFVVDATGLVPESASLVIRDAQSGQTLIESEGTVSPGFDEDERPIFTIAGEITAAESQLLRHGRKTARFDLRLTDADGHRVSPIADGHVNVSGG